VWGAIEQLYISMQDSGELAERHRQQNARWLWKIIDDQLLRAIRVHPGVSAICHGLENEVIAGTVAPESAARQILRAFGLENGHQGQIREEDNARVNHADNGK